MYELTSKWSFLASDSMYWYNARLENFLQVRGNPDMNLSHSIELSVKESNKMIIKELPCSVPADSKSDPISPRQMLIAFFIQKATDPEDGGIEVWKGVSSFGSKTIFSIACKKEAQVVIYWNDMLINEKSNLIGQPVESMEA